MAATKISYTTCPLCEATCGLEIASRGSEVLTKGKDRCTLHIHPADATLLGRVDGEKACITSRAGAIELPIEVTAAIMPGVISVPHGWGYNRPGAKMRIASEHAGVNTNILTDEAGVDPLSGNAILNGIPVAVTRSPSQCL